MSGVLGIVDRIMARAADVLEVRVTRRGFISTTTIVGTAIAATGCRVITQPGSPYTRVTDCPPGALCRDGYTEFCCVINSGVNACPPGTSPAGWWRADYSVYCNGTRYYIDCNDFSGSPPPCRCGAGCHTRKVYCNHFRYGQCNQWVPGTGVIACRMVTCVPPYLLDLGCTPSGAVDNATAGHYTDCAPYSPPPPPPPPAPPPPTSPPAVEVPLGAAIATGGAHLSAFARTSGGGVATWEFDGATWTTPADLGGATTSRVVAAFRGGDVVLVARGSGNDYVENRRTAGTWSGWSSLGGSFTSDPAIVVDGSGVISLFGRGAETSFWVNRNAGGTWSGWVSLGGALTSDPAAVADSTGVVNVFGRGTDSALWTRRYTGGSWLPWGSLGATVTSDPAAVVDNAGVVTVFARMPDRSYSVQRLSGSAWSGWQSLGPGDMNSDPAAVVTSAGVVTVFGRSTDNAFWEKRFSGGSWPANWTRIGGFLISNPTAAIDASDAIALFGRNADNTLGVNRYSGSAWSGWQSLGGSLDLVRGATTA